MSQSNFFKCFMTNAKRFCSASISEKITFTLKWDSWTIYYSIYIYETRLHCINVMYVNIILNRTKFRVNVIMLLILSIMIARIYVVHILSYNCTEFKKVPLNLELPRLPLRAQECWISKIKGNFYFFCTVVRQNVYYTNCSYTVCPGSSYPILYSNLLYKMG